MAIEKCTFQIPTRVEFEIGAIKRVGEEVKKLGGKNVLLVSDKGVIDAGLCKLVEDELKNAGINYLLYSNVVPNPREKDIDAGGDFARKNNIDVLVAIGGGSAIDTAKAIAALITHGGKALDWCGYFMLEREIAPLIAIPTTAGTGSEVTLSSVVTNTTKHIKETIWDIKNYVRVALVDPSLLLGLPGHIMASTGVDALTHAVEAYTGLAATPYTDCFALHAIRYISKNLRDAVHNPNIDNCTGMMLGSNLAGFAFGYADVASVHCMAEALGGRYDIPHGVANAMLLSTMSEFNANVKPERYADVAEAMGVDTHGMSVKEAALAGTREMAKLAEDVGINKMKDFAVINPADFPALAAAAQENTSTPSNPVEMTEESYLELFQRAYNK